MDNYHTEIFASAVACINQMLAAYTILFDDVPTKSEVRRAKKHAQELTPYKRKLSMRYGQPTTNLEPIPALE
jgi:hypothetical protein